MVRTARSTVPRPRISTGVARYLLAAGLAGAAMLLRMALTRVTGELPPFVIFFPTVALVALLLGAGPGIVATLLAALVADYFILKPLYAFGPASLSDAVALGLFVSGGLLISLMAGRAVRARRGEAAAAERARTAEALQQAERCLRESEARFRSLADAVPVLIWQCRSDQSCDYFNRGWLEFTGRSLEQELGSGWIENVHPEDVARCLATFAAAAERHEPFAMEYRLRHHSGEYRWILDRGQPRIGPDGTYLGHVGGCTDITARKRAEEALRESGAQFRDLAEAMPQLVWVARPDGYHEYFNTGCHEYLGMSFDQLVGAGWVSCLHPEDRQRTLERWGQSLKTGEPYEIEYRLRRARDGAYRWFLGRALPVRDERGAIVRWFGTCTDIDDQKRAEERLEQRVRRRTVDLAKALAAAEQGRATLDALLESIPEGVTIADAAGYKFVRASRYMAEMLGVDAKALEGITVYEYVQRWETFEADGVTPVRAEGFPVMQAMREGTTVQGRELVMRRADGAKVPILCNAAPIRDNNGQITGGVGAWRDITEQKRAAAAVRESEERLRFALEACHIGAWDVDLADHTAYRSAEHARIFGYAQPLSQWTVEKFLGHVLPEYRAELAGMVRQATVAGTGWTGECPIRRVDGEIRWIWFSGRHRTDLSGRGRVVGVVQDITERKRAEADLRESERRLKLAQQAAKIGAFEWNVQTGVSTWTPEMEAMHGLAPGTFGKTERAWEQLVHPEDRAAAVERVQQAFETGEPAEQEWRVIWPDGSVHWVMGRFQAFKDAQGKPLRLSGVNIDITERRRAEAALRELNETLEHRVAERTEALRIAKAEAEQANAAKDHFLAVLSHELRTPLTPVVPALDELSKQVPETAREDLEMARRNVELEARLIDDLLDVTRISRGKIELQRESVEVCTMVRRAAEVCAPDIEARRLHFGIEVEGGPYAVNGDPARLQQVFWNLIKNAIKFTPHGGCVGIRCRRDGSSVVAEIKDSGIGIEPAALARIFNAFEQVDRMVTRQFGGLGLGLAISKTLVELHGGTIQAQSEGKGKGATFTVTLPISKATKVGAQPVQGIPAAPVTTRPLEILLVEDHGDTARIMRRMLQAKGHQVEAAGDVATALELAEQHPFDLLLSDLGLPDGSGVDLMRKLREHGRTLPGIALSGYGQDEDIRRSKEAGFTEHLTKPVNLGQLEAAIGRVAAK